MAEKVSEDEHPALQEFPHALHFVVHFPLLASLQPFSMNRTLPVAQFSHVGPDTSRVSSIFVNAALRWNDESTISGNAGVAAEVCKSALFW